MTDQERKKERAKRHLKPVRENEDYEAYTAYTEVGPGDMINWSATWAGWSVAVGTLVFMAAVGLSMDIGGLDGRQQLVAGVVWTGVALIISMFAGGLTSTAGQRNLSLLSSFWHGLVLWGLIITTAVITTAVAGNPLLGNLRAAAAGPRSEEIGIVAAVIILLMLGASIGGSVVGALRSSR